MARLTIALDNPSRIYFPSSVISGKVDIQISKPIKASKIAVKIVGKSSVKFHFGSEGDCYKEKQTIIDRELVLWKSSNGKPEILATNQSFRFSFVLPPNAPSTFKTKKGEIEYKILAEATIPWSFGSCSGSVHLIVLPTPINSDSNSAKDEKKETENVKATLSIPSTVYKGSDIVTISMDIVNYSGKNSATIDSGIECVTSYTGKRSKSSDTQITKTKTVPLEFKSKTIDLNKKKSTIFFDRRIQIPDEAIATFEGNSIIKVQYTVFAIIRFKNSSKEDIKLSIPIIISSPNIPQFEPPAYPKLPEFPSPSTAASATAPSMTNSPRPLSMQAPDNRISEFEPPPAYDSIMMKT